MAAIPLGLSAHACTARAALADVTTSTAQGRRRYRPGARRSAMDGRTSMTVSIRQTWCLAPLTVPSVHPHFANPAKLASGVLPSAAVGVPRDSAKVTDSGGQRED